MLALNEITGIVHDYDGVRQNRHGNIECIPCGCNGYEEAWEEDLLLLIREEHLERGIWERGECLKGD